MISRAALFVVVFAPLVPAVAARGQDARPLVDVKDVVYRVVEGEELKLDILRPEGEGPFPVVLMIHGGAWRGGKRSDMRPFAERFARAGYAAVSPSYRLCPKHVHPAQVHDVKAAVLWVKRNAAEHGFDPTRIGALGASAGAHLAMMLGVVAPADGLEPQPEAGDAAKAATDGAKPIDSRIQAVVNVVGPTDLGAEDIPDVSKPLVRDFLGAAPLDKPELAANASPATFVTRDDAPILTFAGTRDPLIPPTQAWLLAEKMTEAGLPGRVELLIGAGHGWAGPELERTLDESLRFLNLHLRHTPPRP